LLPTTTGHFLSAIFPSLEEHYMSIKRSPDFLRYVLWADAVSCLMCGLLQLVCIGTLRQWLGLPENLLVGSGAFLLPYGAAVACLAIRFRQPNKIVWLLIAGNVIWAVGCLDIVFVDVSALTRLGKAYVIAQALTVSALALLQYLGMQQDKSSAYLWGNRLRTFLIGSRRDA
jgi:hypothetical protein